jgi:hypothetical protein
VKLKAVASSHPVSESADVSAEIFFVLEYVEHDLAGILSASQHFSGCVTRAIHRDMGVSCSINAISRNQTQLG